MLLRILLHTFMATLQHPQTKAAYVLVYKRKDLTKGKSQRSASSTIGHNYNHNNGPSLSTNGSHLDEDMETN